MRLSLDEHRIEAREAQGAGGATHDEVRQREYQRRPGVRVQLPRLPRRPERQLRIDPGAAGRRRPPREAGGVARRAECAAYGCASVATSRVRKRHREAPVADLRRAGLDLVVVALVGDEDMTRDLKAPGVIERTGGDAD